MSANRSNDDLDALAERLRRLPEPPVPAGLEAKLLAAIPPKMRPVRRRPPWPLVAAAAAVLLAFLFGYFFGRTDGPPDNPRPRPVPPMATEPPPTLWNYRLAQDDSAGPGASRPDQLPTSFEWPVQLAVPVAARPLPADLTD
jgi:hypothetical protein